MQAGVKAQEAELGVTQQDGEVPKDGKRGWGWGQAEEEWDADFSCCTGGSPER